MLQSIKNGRWSRWLVQGFSRRSDGEKSSPRGFRSEKLFREQIEVERKRTERSGRTFLLLLIDLRGVMRRNGGGFTSRFVSEADRLTRDTDIAGWYADPSTVGVIYTELGDNPREVIQERIRKRVLDYVSDILLSRDIPDVQMEFHFFPDEKNDPLFYPRLPRDRVFPRLVKRAKDIAGSLVGLVLFSPFFLIIPLLIKLSSRGPVLFVQERLGAGGATFSFLKFRTMYENCSHALHREYVTDLICNGSRYVQAAGGNVVRKMTDDPRITPIGRILRKTSLDELPQFINILRGEMSLVGPRPPLPYEYEHYDLWHRRRVIETKPGLTGLWQVNGRSLCSFEDMVRLDLKYIREGSFWMDLKIILQTPWVMLTGRGAY